MVETVVMPALPASSSLTEHDPRTSAKRTGSTHWNPRKHDLSGRTDPRVTRVQDLMGDR